MKTLALTGLFLALTGSNLALADDDIRYVWGYGTTESSASEDAERHASYMGCRYIGDVSETIYNDTTHSYEVKLNVAECAGYEPF